VKHAHRLSSLSIHSTYLISSVSSTTYFTISSPSSTPTAIMCTENYTIMLPESAVIVSSFDHLHDEGFKAKYQGNGLLGAYGGFVIEVDGEIMLALDDNMTAALDMIFFSTHSLEEDGPKYCVFVPEVDLVVEKLERLTAT